MDVTRNDEQKAMITLMGFLYNKNYTEVLKPEIFKNNPDFKQNDPDDLVNLLINAFSQLMDFKIIEGKIINKDAGFITCARMTGQGKTLMDEIYNKDNNLNISIQDLRELFFKLIRKDHPDIMNFLK